MVRVQSSPPEETRACPHCYATVLKSMTVCPGCRRHLHFDAVRTDRPTAPTFCPLHVEGTIRHPGSDAWWGYSVVVQIQNERGEVMTRHVVGSGSLGPAEARTFTVRVEAFATPKSAV